MGCDIHLVVETKVGEKWVAVAIPDHHQRGTYRNYHRFGIICADCCRGEEGGRTALGIPADISDTAKYLIGDYGVDGHSHSYMELREAAKIFQETDTGSEPYKGDFPEYTYFGVEIDGHEDDEFRLIFWFDN